MKSVGYWIDMPSVSILDRIKAFKSWSDKADEIDSM